MQVKTLEQTEHQIRVLQNEIAVREAKTDFLSFLQLMAEDPAYTDDYTQTRYAVKPIHAYMAKIFQAVERGDYAGKILLLSVPPRTGKSHQALDFCAWYEGKNASNHLIYATYNDDFAKDQGAKVRDTMKSARYRAVFNDFKFKRGKAAAGSMRTDKGGEIKFCGRGGSITGRGGHVLFVDDLLKDAEEAASVTLRDKCWAWFTDTFISRKMSSETTVFGIATRWHEDDWIGRLTDPENPAYNPMFAKDVVVINIPVFAEDNDPLKRKPGELLWPERFTREDMEQRRALNPRSFAALYMGQPTPTDGDFFKREYIRWYTPADCPPKNELRIFAASDHAVSQAQTADYTVLVIVGVDQQQNIYVLDVFWDRAKADTAVEKMIDLMERWKPQFWWAEKGHISKSIGPFLKKRMVERGVFVAVEETTPSADKQTRAQPLQGRMAMGRVFFPKHAYWANRAVDELMKFPNGTHDDFVDGLSWIGIHLGRVMPPTYAAERSGPVPGTFGYIKHLDKLKAQRSRQAKVRARF